AGGACSGNDGKGRGGRGFGPGGPDGPFPLLRALNLTDSQREQIRALSQHRRDGTAPQATAAGLHRQLQVALMADTPDPQKVEQLKAAIGAATAEELAARVELETQIAQILTPEQRAQARQALDRPGPPAGGRRGRPGR
ncbi:MAG: Spy/CpxP family protein refolding chaperone, partial [Acidobacteriota bacterium]